MTIEEAIDRLESHTQYYVPVEDLEALDMAVAALRAQQEAEKNPGEVSDGYHTFNELYHHRAVLFSVICNEHFDLAWKSKHHADGSMYDGMFIVGIETPDGPATYHYDVMPYWDMFHVKELAKAPEWDGHTPAQAIERIGSLGAEKNEPLTRDELLTMDGEPVWCEDGNGNACWCLICVRHDNGCVFLDAVDNETGLWDGDYYGMTGDGEHGLHRLGWIAYRRPLKEAAHD